jgi:hypothetical protein
LSQTRRGTEPAGGRGHLPWRAGVSFFRHEIGRDFVVVLLVVGNTGVPFLSCSGFSSFFINLIFYIILFV